MKNDLVNFNNNEIPDSEMPCEISMVKTLSLGCSRPTVMNSARGQRHNSASSTSSQKPMNSSNQSTKKVK
jgi:hypothetical protein